MSMNVWLHVPMVSIQTQQLKLVIYVHECAKPALNLVLITAKVVLEPTPMLQITAFVITNSF